MVGAPRLHEEITLAQGCSLRVTQSGFPKKLIFASRLLNLAASNLQFPTSNFQFSDAVVVYWRAPTWRLLWVCGHGVDSFLLRLPGALPPAWAICSNGRRLPPPRAMAGGLFRSPRHANFPHSSPPRTEANRWGAARALSKQTARSLTPSLRPS